MAQRIDLSTQNHGITGSVVPEQQLPSILPELQTYYKELLKSIIRRERQKKEEQKESKIENIRVHYIARASHMEYFFSLYYYYCNSTVNQDSNKHLVPF